MASPFETLLDDLVDGQAASVDVLEAACAESEPERVIDRPTPARGWSIRDQLSHLAGFDDAARLAASEPAAFREELTRIFEHGDDPVARYTAMGRELAASEVLDWWITARIDLLDVVADMDPAVRVPWYGPDMSLMSFVTARLMETWAHSTDVRDALGAPLEVSARLRHIAHIGVRTRGFSYVNRSLEVPDAPLDVVLDAPDGATWSWGPGDASERVAGPALDFCLLVTQRRHRDDLALVATGPHANEWLSIAQAFAGPAGPGRPPLIDR